MPTTHCIIITTRCRLQGTSTTAFHTPSARTQFTTSHGIPARTSITCHDGTISLWPAPALCTDWREKKHIAWIICRRLFWRSHDFQSLLWTSLSKDTSMMNIFMKIRSVFFLEIWVKAWKNDLNLGMLNVSQKSWLGWLPHFNQFFLVQRYISGNILTKIRSVGLVLTWSCWQANKQTDKQTNKQRNK